MWRNLLRGKVIVVAVQTRAELLAGFHMSSWGSERLHNARSKLEASATIPVDDAVIEALVQLTVSARREGHGIQDKEHTGDRWIAATAIATSLPLLSGDGIFLGAPGLALLGGVEATNG